MTESNLRSNLRAYGFCNPADLDLIESQLEGSEKKQIENAKTREQIQSVLSAVAERQGMNTKSPKKFVHP